MKMLKSLTLKLYKFTLRSRYFVVGRVNKTFCSFIADDYRPVLATSAPECTDYINAVYIPVSVTL